LRTMPARETSWNKLNRKAGLFSFATMMGIILLGVTAVPVAQGQTFSVLYTFTSPADANSPGSLTVDEAGNLYGTTQGGTNGEGTVYKLDPAGNKTTLYQFQQVPDGASPSNVVRDSAGNLYGATYRGGSTCFQQGCGTVFKLEVDGNE